MCGIPAFFLRAIHAVANSHSTAYPRTHRDIYPHADTSANHHALPHAQSRSSHVDKRERARKSQKERLTYIEEQGTAKSIPTLEYHGDNYRIPFGAAVVELSPEDQNHRWPGSMKTTSTR